MPSPEHSSSSVLWHSRQAWWWQNIYR
jgi:hypothetical protein